MHRNIQYSAAVICVREYSFIRIIFLDNFEYWGVLVNWKCAMFDNWQLCSQHFEKECCLIRSVCQIEDLSWFAGQPAGSVCAAVTGWVDARGRVRLDGEQAADWGSDCSTPAQPGDVPSAHIRAESWGVRSALEVLWEEPEARISCQDAAHACHSTWVSCPFSCGSVWSTPAPPSSFSFASNSLLCLDFFFIPRFLSFCSSYLCQFISISLNIYYEI